MGVTNMQGMFKGALDFDIDISKWDVSSVTNMHSMFHSATSFDIDISRWDVSSVTDMREMFYMATTFIQTLCGPAWVNSRAQKADMFYFSFGEISDRTCEDSDSSDWMGPVAGVFAIMCILIPLIVLVVYCVVKNKGCAQCHMSAPTLPVTNPPANRPANKQHKKKHKKKGSSSSSSSSSSDSSSDGEGGAAVAKDKE